MVCAKCSPHRITIPREYIVHPPDLSASAGSQPSNTVVDLTSDSDGEPSEEPSEESSTSQSEPTITTPRPSSSNLPRASGGEVVRVCNPCVPDPNYSPPPQQSPQHSPYMNMNPEQRTTPRQQERDPFSSTSLPLRFDSPLPEMPPAPRPHQLLPYLPQYQRSPRGPRTPQIARIPPYGAATPVLGNNNPFPPGPPPGFNPHEVRYPRGGPVNFNAPLPPIPPQNYPRVIPEEDECPICGSELPPTGPGGEETARQSHIDQCLRDHTYGESPTSNRQEATNSPGDPFVTPLPPQTSRSRPPIYPPSHRASDPPPYGFAPPHRYMQEAFQNLTLTSSSRDVPAPISPVARPRRPTGLRMRQYLATEKDCVDEGGSLQECVICLEEFKEGEEMARLDCLCKFHLTCIRDWWTSKGDTSCPLHQLNS